MVTKASVKIAKELEYEIISGLLRPGVRLDEAALAERFDVSRTPVREALVELTAAKFATKGSKSGIFVAELSFQQIFEIYEVHSNLEGLCAGLAARRMTDEERTKLKKLHEKMSMLLEEEDWQVVFKMDEAFHTLVRDGSHNSYLIDEAGQLRNRMAPYRRMYMAERRPKQIAAPYGEHGEVVDAILSGDAELAEKLMRMHASVRADDFSDFISVLNYNLTQKTA